MTVLRPDPPLDCYQSDPDLLPISEAVRRMEAALTSLADTEPAALRDALGRILGEAVVSPIAVPNHTNSAMDGYALAGSELPEDGDRTLNVAGTAWAGRPYPGRVGPGQCVRIMTGAAMPPGTDTVVMEEHVRRDGEDIVVAGGHRAGQNVRQAGEDIRRGDVVLRTGMRLLGAELGLLASLGIAEVTVIRTLRVACFSTGDELRSLGESLDAGQVYDSNRYTLYGMLSRLGVDIVDLGVVRDTREAVREAVLEAAARADVVITSGGASASEADFIEETLRAVGQVGFWRIAIRPGRPMAFGRVGDAAFFGLPGNPVAVMVTFYQLVQPALRRMMGERDPRPMPLLRARTATALRKKPGRVEYYRAVLECDAEGGAIVRHTGRTGSGLLHTMSDANCFIVLDQDSESVEAGTEVPVQPFFGLV